MNELAFGPAERHSGESGSAPAELLFGALYSELRRLSQYHLSRSAAQLSMSATTLLHDAYLAVAERDTLFHTRAQFISYAGRVMRGLIVDQVRYRSALKRRPECSLPQDADIPMSVPDDLEILTINGALDKLSQVDSALSDVVTLRFFCGFSLAEIARMQDISERTVQRSWEKARLYLHQSICEARQ